MKYFSILYIFFLFCYNSHSQVGIGTVNPEATLHIAGSQSTIRLESLSHINNPLNDGINLAPVYINKLGELTLEEAQTITPIINIVDASSVFLDKVFASNNLSPSTITQIYNYEITILSQTFVEVKYSLSYNIFSSYNQTNQTGVKITDGQSRQVKTFFTFNDIPNSERFGQISQIYYNVSNGGGTGIFYNNGLAYLALPPGEYNFYFFVEISGSINNTTSLVLGGQESLLRIRFYQ
jgi:hypothetical protein